MKNDTFYLLVGFVLFIIGLAIYYRIKYGKISNRLQLVTDMNAVKVRQLKGDCEVLRKGYLDIGHTPPA